jgi:hypothetical protein
VLLLGLPVFLLHALKLIAGFGCASEAIKCLLAGN